MNDISSSLEAVLFWKNEPMTIGELSAILKTDKETVKSALFDLSKRLTGGIILLSKDDEYCLGTSQSASAFIEEMRKEELSKELSKASLETLAIILYAGPIKRSYIDYIRGVNSQFILRHLEMRGLIERVPDPTDKRTFLYKATFDLMSYIGVSKLEDMPDFDALKNKIKEYEKSADEESSAEEEQK